MRRRGVLDAILYNKGRQFFPSTPVSSANKIGSHDIAEIWLKVALDNIPISHIRTNNIFRTSTLSFGGGWQVRVRTEVGFIFTYALIVIQCSGCEFDSYIW